MNYGRIRAASAGENVTVIRQDDDLLLLGQKDWPWAMGRLTAATVLDLKAEPLAGKYIMFFHGDSPDGLRRHPAHGSASLAFAWSDDLMTWHWPGKSSQEK